MAVPLFDSSQYAANAASLQRDVGAELLGDVEEGAR